MQTAEEAGAERAGEEAPARRPRNLLIAAVVALALAVVTVVARDADRNAACWVVVQVLLVWIAAEDLRTRRIRNELVGASALVALLLRVVFAPSELPSTLLAGAVAFLVFLMFAIVTRGGMGMGDVKLAGLLGVLLGAAVAPALLVGTTLGGVFSGLILLRTRSLRSKLAYGPYLCAGAALTIVFASLPRFV